MAVAIAGALLLPSRLAADSARCPSDNEIVERADRTENLLLEFARAYGQSAGLLDLRKLAPSSGEMHVRLWHGFGLTGVDGLVLTRANTMWTAHVVARAGGSRCYERREVGAAPHWTSIWRNIEALGLGSLPSRPTRDPNLLVTDGYSFVLEWWVNGRYRAFVYDNPDVFKTPEDARMTAIARQLLDAAGISKPVGHK